MKSYNSYKDSGIQWIREIPEHWNVKKIKHTTYVKARVGWKGLRSDEFLDEGFAYLLTGTDIKNGSVDWQNSYFIDKARYDDDPFIQLQADDLLITKDGTIGKIAIVDKLEKPTCLNSGIFVLRSIDKSWHTKYLFNILASNIFKSFIDYTSYGSTILHLYQNVFNEFQFPLPPLIEQTAIANYLDTKTTEIDQIITDKEALINLYEEEKKALINEAVTKGVTLSEVETCSPKLKPSGIEWLGEIPEHWEYISIKRIVETKVTDGPHESPDFIEEGVPFISAEVIKENKIDFGSCRGYISKELDEIYSKKCKPQKEDILLVKSGSTTGKVAMVETDLNFNIWSPLALIRSDRGFVNSKFFFYSLLSEQFKTLVELFWSFGTHPNIGMNVIENLKIAVPPLIEQTAIVRHIETETTKINDKINLIKQEIELLKEYRQALIFEAVTGKIRVDKG